MLFVTFYTEDYSIPFQILKRSCDKMGVELDAVMVEKGDRSWRTITRSKPRFIHDMMLKHKNDARKIVWIDADSRLNRYPFLFDKLDADIATRVTIQSHEMLYPIKISEFPDRDRFEPMTGVVFLSNTLKVRTFVNKWALSAEGAHQRAKRTDQRRLGRLLRADTSIRYFVLPILYCFWRRFWPYKSHPDCEKAFIQVSRWDGKDALMSESLAWEEYRQKKRGCWKLENWVW